MEDALARGNFSAVRKLFLVLILVLMEDALALYMKKNEFIKLVLILVLMEDALAQLFIRQNQYNHDSLNPCFNGRCTRTSIYACRAYVR